MTPPTKPMSAEGVKLVPVTPTEAMIDCPRGLFLYFNDQPYETWTLGQHADAGGYPFGAVLREDERNQTHFTKAHQAILVWRSMLAASPPHPEGEGVLGECVKVLRRAEQFIVNGVALGFIRMPDPSTPDPAHDTLPAIRDLLAKLELRNG